MNTNFKDNLNRDLRKKSFLGLSYADKNSLNKLT